MNVHINTPSIQTNASPQQINSSTGNPVARYVVEPYMTIEETEDGAIITVTAQGETTQAEVYNGRPGEQGPQGERGPQGEQGIQGERGERGEQGIQGERGEQGPTGETGPAGPTGATGANGATGTTFTPSVNADGDLSWTNDGAKQNPQTVNIRGPQGETGPAGTTDYNGLENKPTIPSKVSDLINDSGFITGMTILSYGNSTWNDFITAYNANKVIYCRASSNSNPGSGAQNRLAFMAYVNNAENPTNVEFQYYRSVSSHSNSQQGDQVYVYKLDKTGGWTVTTRENYTKIVAGTGLKGSYSNGVLTISLA